MKIVRWLVVGSIGLGCGDDGGGGADTDGDTGEATNDDDDDPSASSTSTSGGETETSGSGPTGCADIDARLRVTEVSTEGATVWVESPEFFTHVRPLLLAAAPGGNAWVAWVATDGFVHATPLDGDDRRSAADLTVMGDDLRGFVAHDDAVALLIKRDDAMHLVRVANDGTEEFDLLVVGGNDHATEGDKWVNMWGHNGRLAWSGSAYAAYFGHAQNFGADGEHQGDILQVVSPAGQAMEGGWAWGCSHSDDARIVYSGAGPRAGFVPICGSDCYPATGIVYDNSQSILMDPSADCTGTIDTQLGDLVMFGNDAVLLFASPVGRSSFDVAMVTLPGGTGMFGAPVWLQDTPDLDEMHPHAAAYGDDLLVTWDVGQTTEIVRVSRTGELLELVATSNLMIGESSSAVTFANGDVGWARATDQDTVIRVDRVALCDL